MRGFQAMNSLVTVQIDAGTTDLVGNVRSNLVTDVNNGNILVRVPHTVVRPAQPLMLHACARGMGRDEACGALSADVLCGGRVQSRCKSAGLKLTAIQVASAIYATPQKPKPDTRPQLAAGIAIAGCIVFAFVGWIIYLESEKSRSCCGYTWCVSHSLCVRLPSFKVRKRRDCACASILEGELLLSLPTKS